MTTEQQPVVVPPIHLPQGRDGVRGGIAELALRRQPLPLTALLEPREGSFLYAMTAVDHSGRVADRSVIRAMGWHSPRRLTIYEQQGLIVVHPDSRGSHKVNGSGFLTIPAAIRRWCQLDAGERVLLVADHAGQVLVLHPSKALDRVVGAAHSAAFGGDRS